MNNNDLLVIMEAARVALNDAETFDSIAEKMDLADDELCRIREELQNHLNKGAKGAAGR